MTDLATTLDARPAQPAVLPAGAEALIAGGVLCFGGEDWWYHNRAHADMQLMRRFAERTRVLYVNSVVMRKPNLSEGAMFVRRLRRKAASILRGAVEAAPGFRVYSPATLPVHHVPLARAANQWALAAQVRIAARKARLDRPLVWVACPAACDAALSIGRRALVYQRSDRYEEYPGVDPDAISRMDRTLKDKADLTVFASRSLFEEEGPQCRRAHFLDHGVDLALFTRAHEDPRVPPEMRELPRPVAGFFGGIDDHTFDMALVAEVVGLCPDVTFVFVGNASLDLAPLAARPNVRLVPRRPYEDIPHYGKLFDAGLMPWRRNRWIEGCNPIKLKEYLALGLPVVSTPFPELGRWTGVVYTAPDASAFAAAVRRAIAEDRDELRRARRDAVRAYSWEARAVEALLVLAGAEAVE